MKRESPNSDFNVTTERKKLWIARAYWYSLVFLMIPMLGLISLNIGPQLLWV